VTTCEKNRSSAVFLQFSLKNTPQNGAKKPKSFVLKKISTIAPPKGLGFSAVNSFPYLG
jgi:hypothetical protein